MKEDSEFQSTPRTHVIVGAVIIIIGIGLLLRNFGLIPIWIYDFFFQWQFILIVLGLILLLTNTSKLPGLVLILVGTFFLAPQYFREFQSYFIPLGVILVGLAIMLKRHRGRRWSNCKMKNHGPVDSDYFEINAIFGGSERHIISNNFKGGEINAIFGGTEINLLNANLAPQEVFIEITAVFGGLVLIVPSDWEVIIQVDQVFGGFSDKRYFTPDHKIDPTKRLIVKGSVVFGGGEIKSYK